LIAKLGENLDIAILQLNAHKIKNCKNNLVDVDLRALLRIFSDDPRHKSKMSAASFIRSVRREVRQIVAEGTGVHQYTIDHVLQNMIDRCKELKLRVATPTRATRRRVMIVLTVQVMNVLHSGYHRIAV